MKLKNKVELILGTVKRDKESWKDVFERLGALGRVDQKAMSEIISAILDEIVE